MRFLAGAAASFLIGALVAIVIMVTGAYNVAATSPDSDFQRLVLHSTMRRSVQVRAVAELAETWTQEQIATGFRDYDAMCVVCHAAPGKERSAASKGMNPQPPLLSDAGKQWRGNELFWIIKNGVKMTGMPAFGLTHSDEEILAIVGFVRQLPNYLSRTIRAAERKVCQLS